MLSAVLLAEKGNKTIYLNTTLKYIIVSLTFGKKKK